MRWTSVRSALAAGCVALVAIGLAGPAAGERPGPARPIRVGDFDADYTRDLVISAAGATHGGSEGAGAVGVVYGGNGGLNLARTQRLDRGLGWIPGEPTASQNFGVALAAGDFDADGYGDLAICGRHDRTLVLTFGGPGGIGRAIDALPPGDCGDLVAADFDADGASDLVLLGDTETADSRRLWVLHGRARLSAANLRYTQLGHHSADPPGGRWVAGATGDLNGDGHPDLACRYETGTSPDDRTSRVRLFFGGPAGLAAGPAGVVGDPEPTLFGPLAVGDLNGDGRGDLVAGYQNAGDGSGEVVVHFLSAQGVPSRSVTIDQSTPGVPGTPEDEDWFGGQISIGDANGDGFADLAIGVPGEDLGSLDGAGMVTVIPGSRDGLDLDRSAGITQNTPGVPGTAEPLDRFGGSVLFRDVSRDGLSDLAVGSPRENSGMEGGEGLAHVLMGSAGGVVATGSVAFGPRLFGISPYLTTFGSRFG